MTTTSFCLQEVHGKDEFVQATLVLSPRFKFFATFIPGNKSAGRSASCIHKDLRPGDAIVTHMILNVQSGHKNLATVKCPSRTEDYVEAFT